jgi:hypothetical protein
MPPESAPEHKVIITGTGRAGTTFLVHLLSLLGLDTGIGATNWRKKYFQSCNAGLEHDLSDAKTPYIVKNPALCTTLGPLLATGRFIIDHAFIPIRELDSVAASRAAVGGSQGSKPGGLWGTDDPSRQGAVMAELFHGLVHTLVANDIPHTFMHFPRLVKDADYTYGKLSFLTRDIPREKFRETFVKIADPALVHSFAPAGQAPVPAAPMLPRKQPGGLRRLFPSW